MTNQSNNPQEPFDLSTIDEPTLTPIVRQVLNNPEYIVSDWTYATVQGGAGDVGDVISGIFRFKGSGQDWSVILKVVGTKETVPDPSHPRYWKREVLAYQSGEFKNLPAGLSAPRYFGTHQFAKTVVGLWLEDIVDAVGTWSLEHYGAVARRLGQFNGAFLTQRDLPDWTWLSRDWLRSLVNTSTSVSDADQFRQMLDDPTLGQIYKDGDTQRALKLWEDRDIFFDALHRLPQTFLHRDAFRRNLFIRYDDEGNEDVVGVDWSYVGIGGIGEEIVSLVHGSLAFSEVPPTDAQDLENICFEAYLQGLGDVGWQGDPRWVRLGYAAGAALCFGIGYAGLLPPPKEAYPWIEQAFGGSIDQLMTLFSKLRHFQLNLADEARTLMSIL